MVLYPFRVYSKLLKVDLVQSLFIKMKLEGTSWTVEKSENLLSNFRKVGGLSSLSGRRQQRNVPKMKRTSCYCCSQKLGKSICKWRNFGSFQLKIIFSIPLFFLIFYVQNKQIKRKIWFFFYILACLLNNLFRSFQISIDEAQSKQWISESHPGDQLVSGKYLFLQ